MNKEIKVGKIELEIGDVKLHLTIDELIELNGKINEIVGERIKETYIPINVPNPYPIPNPYLACPCEPYYEPLILTSVLSTSADELN